MNQPTRTTRPLPLLMIPLRRCGSHALRLRLNASPQFHSPYPLHIVDFMPLVPLYGDLRDDGAYLQMVKDVLDESSFEASPGGFIPDRIGQAVAGVARKLRDKADPEHPS